MPITVWLPPLTNLITAVCRPLKAEFEINIPQFCNPSSPICRIKFNRRPLAKLDRERNFSRMMAPSRLRARERIESSCIFNFKDNFLFGIGGIYPRSMHEYELSCNTRYQINFSTSGNEFMREKITYHTIPTFSQPLGSIYASELTTRIGNNRCSVCCSCVWCPWWIKEASNQPVWN